MPASLALLAAGLFFGLSTAGAQNAMAPEGQTNQLAGAPPQLTEADETFLTNAAQDGMLEVKLGMIKTMNKS